MKEDAPQLAKVLERLGQLEERVAVLEVENKALRAENAALKKENKALKRKNAALERRLGKTSSTSSKPPSSDSPKARSKRKKRKSSTRSRGAQPGHEPHKRDLLEPDEVIHIAPKCCAHCDAALAGEDTSPRLHQFLDIPPIKPHIIDYMLHALECGACGKTTRAKTPAHVGKDTYGPGVVTLATSLTGSFRMSKRLALKFLSWALGTRVSLGSISHFERKMSGALGPAYEEAGQAAKDSDDETTWYGKGGEKNWVWVACNEDVSYYHIHPNRSKTGYEALVGEDWKGTYVSDRMAVYLHTQNQDAQRCLAHILRDCDGASSRDGPVGVYASWMAQQLRLLFQLMKWHKAGEKALVQVSREDLLTFGAVFHENWKKALDWGGEEEDAPSWFRGLAGDYAQLFTWMTNERVPLTNNLAERELRGLVIARKTSFGTESESGKQFIQRVYSVAQTLKRRGDDVLDFMRRSLAAHRSALPAPALLPA